jgi:hypothetical protein
LYNASATDAMVLDNAPVSMFFAVFLPLCHSQKHTEIVYKITTAARG